MTEIDTRAGAAEERPHGHREASHQPHERFMSRSAVVAPDVLEQCAAHGADWPMLDAEAIVRPLRPPDALETTVT